jgi:hypothetical protein
MIAGQVQVIFSPAPNSIEFVKAGILRAEKLNKKINADIAGSQDERSGFADLCGTVFPGFPADFGTLEGPSRPRRSNIS